MFKKRTTLSFLSIIFISLFCSCLLVKQILLWASAPSLITLDHIKEMMLAPIKPVDPVKLKGILSKGNFRLQRLPHEPETLMIIDRNHLLQADYQLSNLTEILPSDPLLPITSRKGILIKSSIMKPLENLFAFINEQNQGELLLASGYRSYPYQKRLFKNKVSRIFATHPELNPQIKEDQAKARQLAELEVALPGSSEHQAGAIDLTTKAFFEDYLAYLETKDPVLTEKFHFLRQELANTSEGRLLIHNAYKFGFDISYKKGKETISGHVYEPWHLFYRGIHAEVLYKMNWVIQEYWQYLKLNNGLLFASEINGQVYYIAYDYDTDTIRSYLIIEES